MSGVLPIVNVLLKHGSTVGIIGGAIKLGAKVVSQASSSSKFMKGAEALKKTVGENIFFTITAGVATGAIVAKDAAYEKYVEPKLLGEDGDA